MVKRAITIVICAITLSLFSQMVINVANRGCILVDFIDIGQGDAAMITSTGGRRILIDSGNDDASSSKDASIITYLNQNNIQKIDVATISHYDSDHAGGMRWVVHKSDVDMLILPYPKDDKEKETHDEIIAAGKAGMQVVYANYGDKLKIGDNIELEIVYYNSDISDSNSRSIVIEAETFKEKFIFTGDIGIDQEKEIIACYQEDVDVIKVPHHGSKYSSCEEFYKMLTPEFAVISVGNNSYGHPTLEAMERIKPSNAEILRTDEYGTIEFVIDKSGITKVRKENSL